MIGEAARGFAADVLQPRVIKAFRDERDAADLFPLMGKAGLLGVTLPEEFGGAGAGYVAYGLVAREIERIDSGYRSMASVQSSLVAYPIYAYGSDEQKAKYLPRLAAGELIGCFGLTEPDAGSDPAAMRTVARKDGDPGSGAGAGDYVISGTKTWISNSPLSRHLHRLGQIGGAWRTHSRLHPRKGHGGPLRTQGSAAKLSLRTSTTGEIVMDGVHVPADALLPGVEGMKGPFGCLNRARYGHLMGCDGRGRVLPGRRAELRGSSAKQFDRPLAANQLYQKKLADMGTEIALGLQASLQVGRLMDRDEFAPEMISLVKRNNVGKALEIGGRRATCMAATAYPRNTM